MTRRGKLAFGAAVLGGIAALVYWQRAVLFILFLTLFPPRAPLHEAAYRGDLDAVRAIVAARPEKIDELRSFQLDQRLTTLSPLMWAVRGGHLDVVRELVCLGADPERGDRFGRTALWFACDGQHLEIVRYLLAEAGADPNLEPTFPLSPLYAAVRKQNAEMVRLLVEHGARDKNTP